MQLDGKTALVTGGGSGFGFGIASAFVAAGARVMIADIDGDAARLAAARLGSGWVCADVSDAGSVARLGRELADGFGVPDILVNNAGITHLPMPMEQVQPDEFDRVFQVNAKSVYLTARHFVPHMKIRRKGAILNLASTAGLSPRPNLSWYNASKGWMITATKTMAVELAPDNIRVNALCPVAGETPLLASFMGADTPEIRQKFLATIPLGRFAQPEDLANAACYLCSDEASMITGVAMEVDGGRCI